MDVQTLINLGAGGLLAFVGWLSKRAITNLDKVASDLYAFRLKVAEEYVTHTDLGDIKSTLRRIEEKLDGKADR